MAQKNQKICIICGGRFFSPKSEKKVTCSPECRSEYARRRVDRQKFMQVISTEDSIRKKLASRSNSQGVKAAALKASATSRKNPINQRGAQHRGSKVYFLEDPDGNRIIVYNLSDWCLHNIDLFFYDVDPDDPAEIERAVTCIRTGFHNLVASQQGKTKRPVYHYKGWSIWGLPREKTADEQLFAMAEYLKEKKMED